MEVSQHQINLPQNKLIQHQSSTSTQYFFKTRQNSYQEQENYINFLKENKNDPYWKDILNTHYKQIEGRIDMVKSDISKNKFEMKQLLKDNLGEYLESQDQIQKLKTELHSLKQNSSVQFESIKSQFQKLKEQRNQQKNQMLLQQQSELQKTEKLKQEPEIQQKNQQKRIQSSLIYKKLINQWNIYIDIFDIEQILANSVKLEMYEHVCKLLIWLEKFTHLEKNFQKGGQNNSNQEKYKHIKENFTKIMNKYRKIICDVCFMSYKKNNKRELRIFFKKFGQNVLQKEDEWFFRDLFNAHFNKTFKLRAEKIQSSPGQQEYIGSIIQAYSKTVHKSYFYISGLSEELQRNLKNTPLQPLLNKIQLSLIKLIDRQILGEQTFLEIIMIQNQIHSPLSYYVQQKVNFVQIKEIFVNKFTNFIYYSSSNSQLQQLNDTFFEQKQFLQVLQNKDEKEEELSQSIEEQKIQAVNKIISMSQFLQGILNLAKIFNYILSYLKIENIQEHLAQIIAFCGQLIQQICKDFNLKLNLQIFEQILGYIVAIAMV